MELQKKKIKLKKKGKLLILFIILSSIILFIGIKIYQNYLYHQTYEYKLLEKNYSFDEVNTLEKYLTNSNLDVLLEREYNKNISMLVKEKYFMFKNLELYLDYQVQKNNLALSDIIGLVNVKRNYDFYEEVKETNTELNSLMLVNKYYKLNENYEPEDIVKASLSYAYNNNSLKKEAYEAFKNLADAAKNEGYTIVILSGYRTYEFQNELWLARKDLYGTRKADEYAARAGHSEHETGYAIDVADYYDKQDKFGETEAFKWMSENCYTYGFILRYPNDKENITGYSYEPWHYRYVGQEAADQIKNEKITFDEYYAYYLEK